MSMTTKTRKRDLRKLWEDVSIHGKRPPKDEKVWFDNPLIAFLYAKYMKGEPYPEKLEKLFYGNLKAIYSYVYWLVHDLGREAPEHLHNYMIAQSLNCDDSEQQWVDLYFEKLKNKKK